MPGSLETLQSRFQVDKAINGVRICFNMIDYWYDSAFTSQEDNFVRRFIYLFYLVVLSHRSGLRVKSGLRILVII